MHTFNANVKPAGWAWPWISQFSTMRSSTAPIRPASWPNRLARTFNQQLSSYCFSAGFRRCNRRTRHPEWGQLQGQHPHHAGCNMFTLQKQVVWQLAFLEKVATALQIQHLILQNLTGLSFSCCEITWRCGPPTPPRKAKRPKRAPTTSLLFFSTISSRFQVWVLSFLKWSLLNFNLVATYSMCGILRLFMFAKALPSSTYRPSI